MLTLPVQSAPHPNGIFSSLTFASSICNTAKLTDYTHTHKPSVNGQYSSKISVRWYQNAKPFWILCSERMEVAVRTRTFNTSKAPIRSPSQEYQHPIFYTLDLHAATQPTVSKHRRQLVLTTHNQLTLSTSINYQITSLFLFW